MVIRRWFCALLAVILGGCLLGAGVPKAAADEDPNLRDAAIWLANQNYSQITTDDLLDRLLAGIAAGWSKSYVDRFAKIVEYRLSASKPNSIEAAKAVLAFSMLGYDPHNINGLDVTALLTSDIITIGINPGGFKAVPGQGIETQAWGILALARMKDSANLPAAVGSLQAKQCADGHFSFYATPSGCAQAPIFYEQALVLQALEAASQSGVSVNQSLTALRNYLLAEYDPTQQPAWGKTPVSGVATLLPSLNPNSQGQLISDSRAFVLAQQITSQNTLHKHLYGAFGGENTTQTQALLNGGFSPLPALTARVALGLSRTNLLTGSYSAQIDPANLPALSPEIYGPSEGFTDSSITFLVTGMKPGSAEVKVAGVRGQLGQFNIDQNGSAVVKVRLAKVPDGDRILQIKDSSGKVYPLSLHVTDPAADSSQLSGDDNNNPTLEAIKLTPWQFALGLVVVLVMMAAGARGLRVQNQKSSSSSSADSRS